MSAAPGNLPKLIDVRALRCSSCGAPLPEPSPGGGDLVSCAHCGTVQKLVDARAFLDQILLQVNAFVRQALPPGLDANVPGVVDPVARHNLWVSNIGPRLSSEYTEFRFRALHLLSRALVVLPFMTESDPAPLGDPKEAYLFQAKAQSVASLAVDEESRALVAEAIALASAYAAALTNLALLRGERPERFHLLERNFADAAKSAQEVPKLQGLAARFGALGALSHALDLVASARARDALPSLEEAKGRLGQARNALGSDFDLAILLQAVDEESSIARATGYLAQALGLDPRGPSPASLLAFRAFLATIAGERRAGLPAFQRTFSAPDRAERLLQMALDARRAQGGQGAVRVAPTAGPWTVPFWVLEVPYTFQTGVAWRKRGVEVPELLLLAATFPLDPPAVTLSDPGRALTDIFSARERSSLMDRVGGKETSISAGGPVRGFLQASAPRPLPPGSVVPAISTPDDALVLVQAYLDHAQRSDPTLGRQLRLSSPRVVDLLYVPLAPPPPGYPAIPALGALSPRSVGDPSVLAPMLL